ncbi:lipoprotein insertase outer membrane protein LolB [Crenobacter caeni]|uniref:Outer-membrane lipoprotein LolB n=1 Tax=Crenobacter caeni TaxID=2705474 RepID=A0A6B2KSP4_9NEIS|nr:lipoprotein insertase outer membrane protein LolB [Crenobacter caeni]NDV13265.1 outer membrane lipoprotein LolB [Crenobacter caeni]
MKRALFRAALVALPLMLGACATQVAFRPQQELVADAPFALSGRLSVQVDGKGQLAQFDWTHAAGRDALSVNTPLGNTVARVTRDAAGVVLEADGKRWQAEDVETLTEQVLGWPLPLANLVWWVRGHRAPGVPAVTLPDGALEQQGWQIRFTADEAGSAYPRRIELSRDGIVLRIVASQWRPYPLAVTP